MHHNAVSANSAKSQCNANCPNAAGYTATEGYLGEEQSVRGVR